MATVRSDDVVIVGHPRGVSKSYYWETGTSLGWCGPGDTGDGGRPAGGGDEIVNQVHWIF